MDPQRPDYDRSDLVGKGAWTHLAVPPRCECPECREWCPDMLVWVDDDHVQCETCGTTYQPATGKILDPGEEGGSDADHA